MAGNGREERESGERMTSMGKCERVGRESGGRKGKTGKAVGERVNGKGSVCMCL